MKKKIAILTLVLMVAVILTVAFVGCASFNTQVESEDQLVGTWILSSVRESVGWSSTTYSVPGTHYRITLNEDGTFTEVSWWPNLSTTGRWSFNVAAQTLTLSTMGGITLGAGGVRNIALTADGNRIQMEYSFLFAEYRLRFNRA